MPLTVLNKQIKLTHGPLLSHWTTRNTSLMNNCTQIDLEFSSLQCNIRKISEQKKLCIMESRLKMCRFTKVLVVFIEVDVLEVAIKVAFSMPQQFVYFPITIPATCFHTNYM
jgi:hypothetical protein